MDGALKAHTRLDKAIAQGNADRATSILVREYLPALRDLSATVEPERIDAYVASLAERLAAGHNIEIDMSEDDPTKRYRETIGHADEWVAMLGRYTTGVDLQGMRHPTGDPRHTAVVIMDRIDRCRA